MYETKQYILGYIDMHECRLGDYNSIYANLDLVYEYYFGYEHITICMLHTKMQFSYIMKNHGLTSSD